MGSREDAPLVIRWVFEINPGTGRRTMFVQLVHMSQFSMQLREFHLFLYLIRVRKAVF